jgi:pimeloyl-ACP methyl ester carboxylesterase
MKTHPLGGLRGSVRLAGVGFEQITTRVQEFHRAIADMPFNTAAAVPGIEPGARSAKQLHDSITDGVYAAVRGIGGGLFKLAEGSLKAAERNFQPASRQALALTPAALARDNLVSAVSGLVGDFMAQERNPLAVRMGFYREGHRRALTPAALAAAYPEASGRLVVFIHGLCCNEHTWRFYQNPEDPETRPYGDRLDEAGWTSLYLRYNSGLRISMNGRQLARQLQKLVEAWPVPVQEIALIGHSMGGLVARSACYAGGKSQLGWTKKLSQVICLGSPHTGAPLARGAHLAANALDVFPLSRPVAKVLNVRSVGIRDLRHGYIADEDWRRRPENALNADALTPIPRLPGARYHFIGSSFGADEHDLVGKVLGDGLVLLPSATARHLADADTAVLYRAHHMSLLNHPVIYAQIAARLGLRKPPTRRRLAPS